MINRRRFIQIVALGAVLGPRGLHEAWAKADTPEMTVTTWQGIALGAEASIQIHHLGRPEAESLLATCRAELVRLEGIFSLYDEHSALARLNRLGRLAEPPAELLEVLRQAHALSEASGGAFDVSIQPVCALLAAAGASEPTMTELALARGRVDYRRILITDREIVLEGEGMQLTLNGLAQGYITDRVAGVLQAAGCRNTLVDLGEKRALGTHGTGRPWSLGIESPGQRGRLAGVLDLVDGALATSGGYGTVYWGGRHHLLDARIGDNRPDTPSGVTVLAPTALLADGLSTTLAVLAPGEAKALLTRYPQCSAYVINPGEPERLWRLGV